MKRVATMTTAEAFGLGVTVGALVVLAVPLIWACRACRWTLLPYAFEQDGVHGTRRVYFVNASPHYIRSGKPVDGLPSLGSQHPIRPDLFASRINAMPSERGGSNVTVWYSPTPTPTPRPPNPNCRCAAPKELP